MITKSIPLDFSNLIDADKMVICELILNADGNIPLAVIMLHDMSPEPVSHAVRLYTLKENDANFVIHTEIEAFSFFTKEEAIDFANRLPKMSALEILMIINMVPAVDTQRIQ